MKVSVSAAEAGLMSWRVDFWKEVSRDFRLGLVFRKERVRVSQMLVSIAKVFRRWSWGLLEISMKGAVGEIILGTGSRVGNEFVNALR